MLQSFRNASKTWLVKLLLGLLVVSFGVWGINDWVRGGGVQNLATVGDQTVSGSQYSRELSRTLENLAQQSGSRLSAEEAKALGVNKQVRDSLITTAAIDSLGSKLGITYGAEQIVRETQTNPAFLDAQGKFDAAVFRSRLASAGLNEDSFVASERTGRTRAALRSAAELPVVPKTLSEAQSLFINEQRTAHFFTVTADEKDVPPPNDSDLKKFFDEHATRYIDPEFRSVVILKVEPQDVASKITISQQEIEDGYKKFMLEYFQPEKRSLLQLSFPDEAAALKAKQRLDAGEDLMKIATELGAKESDVTLANKTKDDFFDEAIANAAFSLPVNTVSAPVKGGLATVLLKVTSMVPAKQPALDELKPQLTARLQLEKAREELQSVYDAVEDARAGQTKFEDIATKAGLPITTIPALSQTGNDRTGKPVVIPGGQDMLKAIFGSDVGVENDAITLPEGYIWYDVREVIPSAPMKFDNVKQLVTTDWKATRLRTAAEDKAKALVDRLKQGETLEAVAASLNATIKETKPMKRNEAQEDFDSASVSAMFAQPEAGFTYALQGDGKSATLIVVSKILPPAAEVANQQQTDQLQTTINQDMSLSYLDSVKATTKISINESLWRRIEGDTDQAQ